MIVIKNLEVMNYRNVRSAKLNNLKDLNILVGPNNCGKTSILELINSLVNLSVGTSYEYICDKCRQNKETATIYGHIDCMYLSVRSEDIYSRELSEKTKPKLEISLNGGQIDKLVPRVLVDQRKFLSRIASPCEQISDTITMEYGSNGLYASHLSPFIHKDIIEELKMSILYCPELRLQNYKDKDFVSYIRDKKLRGSHKKKWIDFLNRFVDAKITDEKYDNLVRRIGERDVEGSISEQGSGVRSLACLAVDILFSEARVILIDEPELGLNPFVRQEFLRFLIGESKERQIFVATHDPTFVNPVIWRNNSVRVFFYSLIDDQFFNLNLAESTEDPDTFAGYMPHTTTVDANMNIFIHLSFPSPSGRA